jgi:class 3 adenylate cyclase
VSPAALDRLGSLGASAEDDELAELRRRVLVLATAGIAAVSPVWIAVYAVLGLWAAAAIPLLWFLVTAAMLAAQARRPRLVLFRNVELAMMLAFPFLLQWTLGGFAAGSAVCLWALTAPLGAVFFIGARAAIPWFAAYFGLLVVSAALEPVLPAAADMPDAIRVGFFVIDLGAVSLTVFVLVTYFVRAREAEHERSEALLLNILPAPVARRLKRTPGVIADAYPEASVLFADIVGFTSLTERLEPERLISLLDRVFTAWDGLAARHGLEKIKTVGDAYMAVAGVPHGRDDHAQAAVAMALEMPAELAACADETTGPLELRIGIDSGPVVAGVIGRSKFIYDLWGDTVNTASRMESTGEPGRIQVTARTAGRLGDMPALRERGSTEVKGKGTMATFLIDARR